MRPKSPWKGLLSAGSIPASATLAHMANDHLRAERNIMQSIIDLICNTFTPEQVADIILGGRTPDLRSEIIDILCDGTTPESQAEAITKMTLIGSWSRETKPEVSLTFNLATARYTLSYGMWSREFRNTNREAMYVEMMNWGIDLPDSAIAFLSILGK